MNIIFRVDGGKLIGGGHVSRCITLAKELLSRGHKIIFISIRDEINRFIEMAGFELIELEESAEEEVKNGSYSDWLRLPYTNDANETVSIVKRFAGDWIVLDHYGLDHRWIEHLKAKVNVRVMCIDDLDNRYLGADLILDQTHILGVRKFYTGKLLSGPNFALLNEDFNRLRSRALKRRNRQISKIIVLPGLFDTYGFSVSVLTALKSWSGEVLVVMGKDSPSIEEVKILMENRANWSLQTDINDMAKKIMEFDLCIGAAGMTTWERCCLGLPSIVAPVVENQIKVWEDLKTLKAIIPISLSELNNERKLNLAIDEAKNRAIELAKKSSDICDGNGVKRVADCLEHKMRPLTLEDAPMIYNWRNSKRIRDISKSQTKINYEKHKKWIKDATVNNNGIWRIYEEPRPVGLVFAVNQGNGVWEWSFYRK